MLYPAARTNTLAVVSLAVGGLGLFSCVLSPLCFLPFGGIAIAAGVLALRELSGDPAQSGRQLAIAGTALGAAELVVAVLFVIATVLFVLVAVLTSGG